MKSDRHNFWMLLNAGKQLGATMLRDCDGSTAIEFSILAPIFVFLGIGVIDYGIGNYRQMQVQQAAQIGAEYAIIYGFDATAVSQAVVNGSSYSGVIASPAPTTFYGCVSAGVIVTTVYGYTCADGSIAGNYVQVYASGVYSTALTYPAIPTTFTLSGVSTVRIK